MCPRLQWVTLFFKMTQVEAGPRSFSLLRRPREKPRVLGPHPGTRLELDDLYKQDTIEKKREEEEIENSKLVGECCGGRRTRGALSILMQAVPVLLLLGSWEAGRIVAQGQRERLWGYEAVLYWRVPCVTTDGREGAGNDSHH